MRYKSIQSFKCFFVDLDAERVLGFALGRQPRLGVKALAPLVELVLVAAAEEDLAHHEVGAVVVVVDHPVCDVGDGAGLDLVLDGVVDVETANLDLHEAVFQLVERHVRLPNCHKAAGFLVFLQQALLQEVVVHSGFGDQETAYARRDFLGLDRALEAETQDHQPVGVAFLAAFLHGFVDSLPAHGAEARTDMEVGLALAGLALVKALGVQVARRQAVHPREYRVLVAHAVAHASALEVLEDAVFKRFQLVAPGHGVV